MNSYRKVIEYRNFLQNKAGIAVGWLPDKALQLTSIALQRYAYFLTITTF